MVTMLRTNATCGNIAKKDRQAPGGGTHAVPPETAIPILPKYSERPFQARDHRRVREPKACALLRSVVMRTRADIGTEAQPVKKKTPDESKLVAMSTQDLHN
jgi:hypothetical protein